MDRYDWIAQEGNEGLWDWDLLAGRIHFSPRWHALLGAEDGGGSTPEEWFGRIPAGEREEIRRVIDSRLGEDCGKFDLEHSMLHADGSCRRMSCIGIITRDRSGRAVRVAGAHTDITAGSAADPVTGLANPSFFLNRVARSLLASRQNPDFAFALLLLAVDRQDAPGSPPGPESGKTLVVAAARRLETRMITGAVPGRDHALAHAGEGEFLILLEGLAGADEARSVADRLLGEMAAPFRIGDREIFAAVSAGIAVSASGYRNPLEMLRDADTALHRARSLGGGRGEFFDTAALDAARRARGLESDLRSAIRKNELSVAYQPIVDLSSYRIAGFEALLRWRHPERGEVSPAEFIPIAEQTGLIVPMGLWVLREACRQVKTWRKSLPEWGDLRVSVNLSPVQIKDERLVREVGDILRAEEYESGSLVLEITESGIMENAEAAVRLLMQLRVMGVRIAIDDFGTGYSSLSHLCRFPLDYLKIDHSFVRGIETGKDALEVVRTVSELARRLGLDVIAEGIETPGQLERVRSVGCAFGQGFLFARPVAGETATALLAGGPLFEEMAAPAAVPAAGRDAATGRANRGGVRLRLGLALAGLAVLVMLGMGFLQVRRDEADQTPVAVLAGESGALAIIAGAPASIAGAPAGVEAVAVTRSPVPARKEPAPAAEKEKAPMADYSFPVTHDHRLGNCSGKLRITSDTLSYIAGKKECRFTAKKSAYSCRLDGGKLEIKAGGRTYRFRPDGGRPGSDSRAADAGRLQDILGYISRLHPEAVP